MITAKDIQEAEKVLDEQAGAGLLEAAHLGVTALDAITAQRDSLLEDLKYCAQWLKQREGFVPEFLAKAILEGEATPSPSPSGGPSSEP